MPHRWGGDPGPAVCGRPAPPGAADTDVAPPGAHNTKDGDYAEDEDPQRGREAVPGDRHRKGDAPPGEPEPPARAQADPADPAPVGGPDGSPCGRQEDQEAAGEVAQPASRESEQWHA